MQRIGIIAADDERGEPRRKWYEFWKKEKRHEFCHIERWSVDGAVAYLPWSGSELRIVPDDSLAEWLARIQDFFLDEGIRHSVCSHRVRESLGDVRFESVMVHSGLEMLRELSPGLIRELVRKKGQNPQKGMLLYVDDAGGDLETLEHLGRDWKYLSIMTKNTVRASELAGRIMDEYGLPVEVREDDGKFVRCDFAVVRNGQVPKVPRDAVVVNLSGQKTSNTKAETVNWAEIEIGGERDLGFPVKVDSLAAAEALSRIGALSKEQRESVRISSICNREICVKI